MEIMIIVKISKMFLLKEKFESFKIILADFIHLRLEVFFVWRNLNYKLESSGALDEGSGLPLYLD